MNTVAGSISASSSFRDTSDGERDTSGDESVDDTKSGVGGGVGGSGILALTISRTLAANDGVRLLISTRVTLAQANTSCRIAPSVPIHTTKSKKCIVHINAAALHMGTRPTRPTRVNERPHVQQKQAHLAVEHTEPMVGVIT